MSTTVTIEYLDKTAKLSSLWIFVFLNMIFRDLHEFGRPGFVEEIMSGVVNGVQITEGLMLMGGIMIAIPLLIVPLIHFLNFKSSRTANLVIAPILMIMIVANNMEPDLDDILFAVIEVVALFLVFCLAWGWKEQAN